LVDYLFLPLYIRAKARFACADNLFLILIII